MIYKIWIHIEEIDEDKDHYEDIDEPYVAGSFNTKLAAKRFVENELLAVREVNTGLRNACKTTMRLLRNLGSANLMSAMQKLKSCREVLDNAVKQGIPAVSDRCPNCGAGCDERELLKKDFLDIEAVQMHYKCNKCGSEIIEEFTLSDVFIDSPHGQ
jgi:predicted RNA-binding Zn-ribbon protein involved in translation (DUF1610 family)